jgi:phage terminase large subunit-like protein
LPQVVVTTTPRPIPLLKRIMEDHATATSRSRTADNANNLAPAFLAEMMRRYGDTALGRQELEGEIVEGRMTGLWKSSHLDQARLLARPELVRIVVPSTRWSPTPAPTAVASSSPVSRDKRGYALSATAPRPRPRHLRRRRSPPITTTRPTPSWSRPTRAATCWCRPSRASTPAYP